VNGPGNARYSSGLTRDDGTFLIDLLLPEGPGWTDASTPNPMVEVYAGSGELGWSPLWAAEVLPTTVVDDLVLELEPCGAIEGRVRSPTERGGDREVVAAYDGRRVAVETVAGNDGAYRLDGLPPGSYLVLPVGPKRVGAHGGGWGRGAEAFLPPPHEFFEFPHRVAPGETVRVDLDLARDGLGRIEATMPTGVEAEQVAYGRVIGGRRHGAACLGGQEEVRSLDWSLRDHVLLPGSYEVWLQDRDGRRLADTAVTVRRAEVSRAVLVAPAAAFNVPVVGLAAERDAGADVGDDDGRVEVVRVEVFDATAPDPERPWYEWGGYRVSELPGALRIAGLPGRRVRALLYAPGRPETWSNEVFLPAGGEGTAQPVVFPRGVALRLELVWPQARAPSDPVAYESLRVWVLDSDTGRPVRVGVRPDAEKPASVLHLDALQRGRYELYVEAPGVRAAFAEFAIEDEAEPPVIRLELRAEE
jgi:hypothetical protein